MFKIKKAILFINKDNINNFNNLIYELQLLKNIDIYTYHINNNIDNIDIIRDKLINIKYLDIYVIAHNTECKIAINLANKYKEIKKVIISNPHNNNLINNINCNILTIQSISYTNSLNNSYYIYNNSKNLVNYLITIKDIDNNIYTSNRYLDIYKYIIDFITIEHTENTIHINV